MKDRKQERLAFTKIGGWWMRNMVVLVRALHYGRAARRDERKGFPFTAAMEWHRAAELFLSGSFAAEYCWGQWERIVRLPRQLAGPVGSSRPVIVPPNSARPELVLNQIPFATAA